MNPEEIKKIGSDHFNIPIPVLESKWRKREAVIARQSCMMLMILYSKLTLKKIGAHFGNRDHSTVIHARETIQDLIDTDRKFKRSWDALLDKVVLQYFNS